MTTKPQSPIGDLQAIHEAFPVLSRTMNGKPLVYLDNAATAQKPKAVIERLHRFYSAEYATIHRGVYALSQDSTVEVEEARKKCQSFLNAESVTEIVFVRGTTEAINLVSVSYGDHFLNAGDEILITEAEHHANIVPWQELCRRRGCKLKVAKIYDNGEFDMASFDAALSGKTKLVAVTHVSNVLGTVFPVEEITQKAHRRGALVLVDGAQAAPHMKVDVRAIGCDFYCFSGHKAYGPTGIGVLYGKQELLDKMHPYQFGGDMIERVRFESSTYALAPAKFEAGTPAIAETVGLGRALHYLMVMGLDRIHAYENELLVYATEKVKALGGIRIIGEAKNKTGVLSFTMGEIHPHDIGTILDQEGIAIRAGHHCAQPLMDRLGIPATARASFAFYNTFDDIDALVRGLKRVREIL